MATFVKRGNSWQVKVRRQGYKPIARTFDTKAAGEKWARGVERSMDLGTYVDTTEAERTSLREALERYEREVTPAKRARSRSAIASPSGSATISPIGSWRPSGAPT